MTFLAFSRGKDSLAAWLRLREFFDEIRAVCFYLVPRLQFESESLAYYERFFDTKILRLPHPSLARMLNELVFQAPGNCAVIESRRLPERSFREVFATVAAAGGVPEAPYATGVRAADSPLRRIAYRKVGLWRQASRQYLPVGDWNKARVLERIRRARVRLPIDYRWFGRSFDGLDYRFLAPLKQHAPEDYRRVLEFFPLAEAELFRYERMGFKP